MDLAKLIDKLDPLDYESAVGSKYLGNVGETIETDDEDNSQVTTDQGEASDGVTHKRRRRRRARGEGVTPGETIEEEHSVSSDEIDRDKSKSRSSFLSS